MLVLFLQCYYSTFHFFSQDKLSKIGSYGFTPNSSYSLRYSSQNKTDFIIFFLGKEYTSFVSSRISPNRICKGFFPETPYKTYYLDKIPNNRIEGFINESIILVLFIANCGSNQLTLTVQFKNDNSYLDSREFYLPQIYLLLSFIYPFISLFWIINALRHRQFHVKLHTALSFYGVIKAFSLNRNSDVWYDRALYDKIDMTKQLICEVVFIVAHSYLFLVNSLILNGWGLFNASIPRYQKTNIGLVTTWFFLVISISHYATYPSILAILNSMASLVGCIYAKMVYDDIVSDLYVISYAHHPTPTMAKKVLLAIKLGGIVTVWMTVLLFFLIYFCVVDVPKSIRNLIFELFFLAVYIIDCVLFFYRKDYEPFDEENNEEDSEQNNDPQMKLVFLKEPNEEWFALTDTHTFSNNNHSYI